MFGEGSNEDDNYNDNDIQLELLQWIRKDEWLLQHHNWLAHVKKLEHEKFFSQMYQMSLQPFMSLVDMIYQYISNDSLMYDK